ncbi:MAG: alpha/beta fold hydrolase [PVC group bacterium]
MNKNRKEKVLYYTSEGLRLAGELYLPAGEGEGNTCPGIVLCQGLSGVKEKVLPEIAALFREEGFACLAFDYRGFGESEGERPRLFPLERAADIGHAVSFLVSRPEIDARRVGLYGLSYGATVVPWAAAFDRRVVAAAAVSGSGNGERWMRLLRTAGQWLEFTQRLEEDRIEVVRTGKSRLVPLTDIIPFSDEFWRKYKSLSSDRESSSLPPAASPGVPEFPLSSAASMVEFSPDTVVGLVSPRPILFIHGEEDDVCPVELAVDMCRRAGVPKKIVILPGRDHIDLDHGDGLREQVALSLSWFREHL